ncbi:nucleoside hydrolase [Parasulfitobacter algicola]|uniref:Nucleoside hydrolase n=1 Tax=Parasulfitobacter algicola TaxID=2614809 RepID=A0ABX2IYE9_9RHOB|nr:nucleoside hydrolase [Sulfitobacter algicola]NSX56182.1 nucleoside hydrolase [Sulfitobacter algicola]
MKKLIIDTDPGIDDAIALFFASGAPDIDLLGLTTVFGNVTTDQATRNALYLAEMAELDIPVAKGAVKPWILPPFPPVSRIHGDFGMGDVVATTPLKRPIDQTADEYLVHMAQEHKGELTVCALGPLTNIAAAIRRDPWFAQNCAQIVIMGGSVDAGGNITDHAEANIYHDPHAAAEVFASGANITMIGLDVTHKIQFSASDFSNVAWNAPKLGGLLQQMSYHYIKFYQTVGKFDGCSMHDPTAVLACTHPGLFKMRDTAIDVVCSGNAIGQTIARPIKGRSIIKAAIYADVPQVKALLHDRLGRLP